MADGTRIVLLFGRRERAIHPVFYIGILSRLMTHIRNSEIKDDDYERLINVETDRLGTIKLEPWALRYVHLSKLPLHSFGLFAHDDHLISGRPVPALAGGAHFIKLAFHSAQLPPKNAGGYDTDYYQRQGEQANSARPSRHNEVGLASLFLMAATATVFVAFKSAEYADEHGSLWWWVPFLCFLGSAIWFAYHAVRLTL